MRAQKGLLAALLRWLAGVLAAGFLAAALLYLAPGARVDERELDPTLSEEARAALRAEGAGRGGLLGFYVDYLRAAVRGEFGDSRTYGVPVRQLLEERWRLTASSVLRGWSAAWVLGLGAALLCARWRWSAGPFTAASAVLVSMPSGLLAILFFVLRWPVAGILAAAVFPRVFRYTRNLLEAAAGSPHCLAARARGVSRGRLLFFHQAWPVWPEAVTLAGVTISAAIGAAIPAEALCDVAGLGQLAWKSALARDLPLLVALTLVIAAVTLGCNMLAGAAASLGGERRWRA
ncbi:MAG: ABC transporter permease [Acidobacteria bacterium]|nr:ABC transporter permease [Acidobacteriota bacterium]